MKVKGLNSAILYFIYTIGLISGALLLKDRRNEILLLTIFISTFLFLGSISKYRLNLDYIMSFSLPIALSITKVAWIAHPIHETVGILSVGAGLYLCATDIVLIYFLWRLPQFKSTITNEKWLIWLYIFLAVLSCLYAYNSEFAFYGVLMLIKCYILYEWFCSHPNADKIIQLFIYGAESALLFQGIVGILQYISAGPIGLSFLGENNDALRYRIVDGSISRGAAGTFEHSSKLAIFTIFALFLILFSKRNEIHKCCMMAWGFIILYLAGSRTAMLVFALALVYDVWRKRSWHAKRKTLALFTVLVLLGGIGGGIALQKGLLDFIVNSDLLFQVMNRINHWILAFSFISQHWFLGYGINNYAAKMSAINSTDFYYLNPVHNNYILNWFELGAIGAFIYICILLMHFFKIKHYITEPGTKKAALLFLVAVVIYNFTGWAFATPGSIYLLWITLGMIDRKDDLRGK